MQINSSHIVFQKPYSGHQRPPPMVWCCLQIVVAQHKTTLAQYKTVLAQRCQ
jgi:hypothetical protein